MAPISPVDLVARILENPDWNKKTRRVKTLKEIRQIILDFCEAFAITSDFVKNPLEITSVTCPFLFHTNI